MPAYATAEDLAQYGVSESATADIDADAITAALEAASSFCDGYIATQYDLPLAEPYPEDLKMAVAAIAAWTLLKTRGFNPENPADAVLLEDRKAAVKWLQDVSQGRSAPQLTDQRGPPGEAQTGPFVRTPVVDSSGNMTVGAPTRRGW